MKPNKHTKPLVVAVASAPQALVQSDVELCLYLGAVLLDGLRHKLPSHSQGHLDGVCLASRQLFEKVLKRKNGPADEVKAFLTQMFAQQYQIDITEVGQYIGTAAPPA